MREVINLFSQTESRDELGIGQVRDVFSDRLFPGTSVLLTRARYLLLIPWCYRAAARRATSGADLERRAADNERRLIVALNNANQHDGLIGRQVLTKLKNLPSVLYWSSLTQWGVLVGGPEDELAARTWRHEADELVERAPAMWSVPPMPEGFPDSADRLDLSGGEATWVRERMLSGSRGSLLERLLHANNPVWNKLPWAWDVPVDAGELKNAMEHARLFSLATEGAALTYNLSLASAYEAKGFTQVEAPVELYREKINAWVEALDPDRAALQSWDREDLWSTVLARNPRVSWATRSFVDSWVDHLNAGKRPDDDGALKLVTNREKRQKGTQSRLTNDKLLRTWSGAAGTARLAYRWGNVRRLLTDVNEGLQGASA